MARGCLPARPVIPETRWRSKLFISTDKSKPLVLKRFITCDKGSFSSRWIYSIQRDRIPPVDNRSCNISDMYQLCAKNGANFLSGMNILEKKHFWGSKANNTFLKFETTNLRYNGTLPRTINTLRNTLQESIINTSITRIVCILPKGRTQCIFPRSQHTCLYIYWPKVNLYQVVVRQQSVRTLLKSLEQLFCCKWRPCWMSENHFRSHFWPFQIDTELFIFFLNFDKMAAGGHFGWDDNVNYRTHPIYIWMSNACVKFEERTCSLNPSKVIVLTTKLWRGGGDGDWRKHNIPENFLGNIIILRLLMMIMTLFRMQLF